MQWSEGVAQAIATSKAQNTPLLVLVEPPASVQRPTHPANESAANLYARLSTRALHNRLFSTPRIIHLVKLARLHCLRFAAESSNADFVSFSAFFPLLPPAPNLFLIAPHTGVVLFRLAGYVSPLVFQNAVLQTVKSVCALDLDLSALPPVTVPPVTVPPVTVPPVTVPPATVPPVEPAAHPSPPAIPAAPRATPADAVVQPVPAAAKALKLPPPRKLEARLRCRLPDGRQLERVFASNDLFSVVRAWAYEHVTFPPAQLTVAMTFPRYTFSPADDAKQLAELDVMPSANLIVSCLGDPPASAAVHSARNPSGLYRLLLAFFALFSGFFNSFFGRADPDAPASERDNGRGDHRLPDDPGHADPPSALRMTRESGSRAQDDGHWVSNGNSTQFGWRPDGDDEQR